MWSSASHQKSLGRSRLLGGALVTLMCVPAIGGPEGERVVSGNAKFKRHGDRTVIRASDGAIINYTGFDIGAGERVRFIQPGSDARVLNRIRSDEPTRIDGMLRSNGNVYLVNRSGVLFGADAIINVGGLHAAAGNITNSDFLNGVDRFTLTGDLTNMGRIEADHVTLAGNTVSNLGTIVANEGFVAMVAGDQVLVGEHDGRMFAKIDSNRVEALDYAAQISGVTNAGAILASDGQVIVGAGDFYGIVTHTSTNIVTNELTIESGDGGITRLAGNVDVSGAANGNGVGGSARILGDRVAVDDATIDATGARGGGEILIGGEFQGSGPIRNAKRTFVGANTTLDASAIDNGDGGRIIVWADELTGFAGDLIATGGAFGGDGGFGEISGKHGLIFKGSVNLLAANGTQGTILFDPDNIDIIDGAGGADDGELGDNQILGGDGGAVDFQISEVALEALAGSVILQANANITVADLTDNELGFQAIGGESVEITADFDNNGTGTFSMAAGDTISTQGGDLNIRASEIKLGQGIRTNGGDIALEPADGDGTLELRPASTLSLDSTGGGADGDIFVSVSVLGSPLSGMEHLTIDAGSGLATLGSVGVPDRAPAALSISADEIDLTGDIRTGTITLQQGSVATSVQIGGADSQPNRLDLTTEELGRILNGAELLAIGREDGASSVMVLDAQFRDPVVIRAGVGGEIRVTGDLRGINDASFHLLAPDGLTRLAGSITTNESEVRIESPTLVQSDSVINTDGGIGLTISILGDIDGPGSLVLDADSGLGGIGSRGSVRIEGDIGSSSPLAELTIEGFDASVIGDIGSAASPGINGLLWLSARDEVTLRSSIVHVGGVFADALSGTILSGPTDTFITAGESGIQIAGGDLRIANDVDLSMESEGPIAIDSAIRLQSNADDIDLLMISHGDAVTIGGDIGDSSLDGAKPRSVRIEGLMIDLHAVHTIGDQTYSASGLTLRDDLGIHGDGALVANASVFIPGDIRIDAAGRPEGGELVRFEAGIAEAADLTIAIGDPAFGRTGDLAVAQAIGTQTDGVTIPVGDVVIENVGRASFENVWARSVDIQRAESVLFGDRVRTFNGPFRFLGGDLVLANGIDADAGQGLEAVNITASNVSLLEGRLSATGNSLINAADTLQVASGASLVLDGNLRLQGGRVELDSGSIRADGHRITVNSSLRLGDDTLITADTIRLNGVTITDGTRRSLTLRAENSVELNGPVGVGQPLQSLDILSTGSQTTAVVRNSVRTRERQLYRASTTLSEDARLRTTGPGAAITFDGRLTTADAEPRVRISSRGALRLLGPSSFLTPTTLDATDFMRFRRPVSVDAPAHVRPRAGASFERQVTIDDRLRIRGRSSAADSDVFFGGRILSLSGQGELDILLDGDRNAKGFNLPSNADGTGIFNVDRAQRNATDMPLIWVRGNIGVNKAGAARPLGSVILNGVRPRANGVPRGTRAVDGSGQFDATRLPASSTILLGPKSPRSAGKRVPEFAVQSKKFVTGFHEAVTSNANVTMKADKLTLADTNILGSLEIAPLDNQRQRINLLARPASRILTSEGVIADEFASIVIGGIERDGNTDRFRSDALSLGPLNEVHLTRTRSGVVSLDGVDPADPRFKFLLPEGGGGLIGDAQATELLDDFVSFDSLFEGFERSRLRLTIDGAVVPAELGNR